LVASAQTTALHEFAMHHDLQREARASAWASAARSAVHQNVDIGILPDSNDPWVAAYNQAVKSSSSTQEFKLPAPGTLPREADEFASDEREKITTVFESVYAISLYLGIRGKEHEFTQWMKLIGEPSWPETAAICIAQIGMSTGLAIRTKEARIAEVIGISSRVPTLRFEFDRQIWGIRNAFYVAIKSALPSAIALLCTYCGRKMAAEEIGVLLALQHLSAQERIDLLLAVPPSLFDQDDAVAVLSHEIASFNSILTDFSARSEFFLACAELAMRLGKMEMAASSLTTAISDLLGYRYHKDMTLYEVLLTVEACQSSVAPDQAKSWYSRLGPIAQAIGDFTDGDETSDSLADYGRVLSQKFPRSGWDLYIELQKNEKLFLADRVFRYVVGSLDLADPLQAAIARTATDDEIRRDLVNRAEAGSAEAARIVTELAIALGDSSAEEHKEVSGMMTRDEATQEVSDIPPDRLKEKLESFSIPYDRANYVKAWFEYWDAHRRKEAYLAVAEWLKEANPISVDFDLLFRRLPYAREFEGENAEFRMLCQAHSAIWGWSIYAGKEKPNKVFSVLARRFPQRWRDFIKCTLAGDRPESYGFLPVPTGVKFLIEFGAVSEASLLTDAAVSFVEELMGDLQLPGMPLGNADSLEVLFARLFSISGAVRERTACVLSDLLQSSLSVQVMNAVIRRIDSEVLTSRIPLLLLPIVRAVRNGFRTNIADLQNAIHVSSRVSDVLMSEILNAQEIEMR
jgi:hypothetical protein